MSQGYNRYPIKKSAAYIMLSKFVPEKNQPFNTNRDHTLDITAIYVLFYQQKEPVDSPSTPSPSYKQNH